MGQRRLMIRDDIAALRAWIVSAASMAARVVHDVVEVVALLTRELPSGVSRNRLACVRAWRQQAIPFLYGFCGNNEPRNRNRPVGYNDELCSEECRGRVTADCLDLHHAARTDEPHPAVVHGRRAVVVALQCMPCRCPNGIVRRNTGNQRGVVRRRTAPTAVRLEHNLGRGDVSPDAGLSCGHRSRRRCPGPEQGDQDGS